MIEGTLSIQSGDNPRIVKEKLVSFLKPADRKALKGSGRTLIMRNIFIR